MSNMQLIEISPMKSQLKERVINLRKRGLSYREILQKVPVSKSTISLWLHSIGLSRSQKQRLTDKRLTAIKLGAEAKHRQRIICSQKIMYAAQKEIGKITKRELFLIGVVLYWAEGSKEKEHYSSCRTIFTNTDPDMIVLFLSWLRKICNKGLSDLIFDLYIHESQHNRTAEIIGFWSEATGYPIKNFQHIYYKKGNPKTTRKNIGDSYHGTLKIIVRSSSSLNRRIAGWTQGVVKSLQ